MRDEQESGALKQGPESVASPEMGDHGLMVVSPVGCADAKAKHWLKRCAALGYPMVGTHAAYGGENERIVEAFNWTVVFLMAMPYVILAGVAGWIFCHYNRVRRRRLAHQRGSGMHLVKKGASSE